MRKDERGRFFYSPSDLVTYLGCPYASVFDLQQLLSPAELPPPDDGIILLQERGLKHEHDYLEHLRQSGLTIAEIPSDIPLPDRIARTIKAMEDGAQIIYQAVLHRVPWNGYADFLLRVDGVSSRFGNYSYEVADTKLALSAKPEYVIQLCVYCDLLAVEQHRQPQELHVVLGDRSKVSLRANDFKYYQKLAAYRFEAFMANPPMPASGEPCSQCDKCRWLNKCEEDWEKSEHLSLIANITGNQIKKLRVAGITSMRKLAMLPAGQAISKLQPEILSRLKEQARLQIAKKDDGQNRCDVLPLVPSKGFARLPQPNAGDIFFDMEGDPLYEAGAKLEYLFGFVLQSQQSTPEFVAFWGHDRAQEKKAFEDAVDFMMTRLKAYPDAYIYHYASYEETALKYLAMYHGTRETEVDFLLRNRKLVDLFKVVHEAIRISEPRYSIKNLEIFYADKRAGGVTNAGDSIVMYEKWRQLKDDKILQEISDYNEFDCRSTLQCRDWLLKLRPDGVQWFSPETSASSEDTEKEARRREAEARTESFLTQLRNGAAEEDKTWRELVGHLLEFHRREAKPQWWAMFNRQDMTDEELVDDAESIGMLSRDPTCAPYKDKRSTVHTFVFPPQDFKMRLDGNPLRSGTLEPAGQIVALDDKSRRVALKLGPTRTPLPDTLSLIPEGPIGDQVLREAVYRYAEAVIGGRQQQYAAITGLLRKDRPHLAGVTPGQAIISKDKEPLAAAVDAVCLLNNSHMLIQGPPGTGKTYTSSHAIVELLKRGKRVGIASNSHKAINNLLAGVDKQATLQGVRFSGIKKSSGEDQFFQSAGQIANTVDNNEIENGRHQLVAGTAWLFARSGLDQALDYLFIDEAGQVSLANVIAMGLCARNIVLVGDQMQLAQPIQGTHPENSGLSALEYLLGDASTVPEDRGIFLAATRRMHPQICRFISDAVYDGRLHTGPDNARQRIKLNGNPDPEAIATAGLKFVDVHHDGCTQKSEEEVERLRNTYMELLSQRWIDEAGVEHAIGSDDILVVTPYNMQVDLLEKKLPAGARVGTVDKFQGQEAAVVLISMVTSSGEDIPRNIEFLFSRNRLNVAISRARCLAVIFASPRLLEISCSTINQMRLVNTLCWAKAYADENEDLQDTPMEVRSIS